LRAYAKVNIFLKITGTRGDFHEIASRFVLLKDIYDELEFVYSPSGKFRITGCEEIPQEQNLITRAYEALLKYTKNKKIEEFFKDHAVKVVKNIPAGGGLGGGSSDAAAFLKMANDSLSLDLDTQELSRIALQIGSDVPFFVYSYKSANVRGIGEEIEPFEDNIPDIEIFTMDFGCNTAKVYKNFRSKFFKIANKKSVNRLFETDSEKILKTLKPIQANDLYQSAADLCVQLKKHIDDRYLSGSGSTLFKPAKKEEK